MKRACCSWQHRRWEIHWRRHGDGRTWPAASFVTFSRLPLSPTRVEIGWIARSVTRNHQRFLVDPRGRRRQTTNDKRELSIYQRSKQFEQSQSSFARVARSMRTINDIVVLSSWAYALFMSLWAAEQIKPESPTSTPNHTDARQGLHA